MKRMLFNAIFSEELRVAAVDGQKLINFDIETSNREQRRGNIYKSKVTRVENSLGACFVDYGVDRHGFLPFKEIHPLYTESQKGQDFNRLRHENNLIVQVEKDERGNKGAALTTYITLPGRYLVLMPNNERGGGISRRIDGDERDELKQLMSQLDLPVGMGVILRTAALGRNLSELQWDLSYLLKLWHAIDAAAKVATKSSLIYQESSLVIRSIRDHFNPNIAELLIDNQEVYEQAHKFMLDVMPDFADRVKFYNDDVPLFSRFQIEHQIESAYSRTVILPAGGVIVIDHTEALTSIDVNSAKSNRGSDIEQTATTTNIEAATEIARQLRLRDLGGLVVVDFIDMENPRNQRDLEAHFKEQLTLDRARIQMGKLSKFGLIELSRQRLQASLDESSTIPCPRCAGIGAIRGIESSALHLLRILQEEALKNHTQISALRVQLPVDIATYLLNERRDDVSNIESRLKVKVILIPNINFDSPNYRIKKISLDGLEVDSNKPSYNLVEPPEETISYKPQKNQRSDVVKAPTQAIVDAQKINRVQNTIWNQAGNMVLQSLCSIKKIVNPLIDRLLHAPQPQQQELVIVPIEQKPKTRVRKTIEKTPLKTAIATESPIVSTVSTAVKSHKVSASNQHSVQPSDTTPVANITAPTVITSSPVAQNIAAINITNAPTETIARAIPMLEEIVTALPTTTMPEQQDNLAPECLAVDETTVAVVNNPEVVTIDLGDMKLIDTNQLLLQTYTAFAPILTQGNRHTDLPVYTSSIAEDMVLVDTVVVQELQTTAA